MTSPIHGGGARSPGLALRPFRPGDEEALNRAFSETFGLARPLAEWEWKFGRVPREVLLAVDAGGEPVGQFAALPVSVQLDGRLVRAGQAVDVFCRRRPGAVRDRVFLRLAREFFARFGGAGGLAFLFGFPGERHLRLGRLQLGYAQPRPVPLWRRDPGRRPTRWTSAAVREGFDGEAIDRLWERAAARYPVAVVRDAARAGRRYRGRAGVEYLHLVARRGSLPEAWAVLRHEGEALRWADLVWDGRRPQALAALDRGAMGAARKAGAEGLEQWLGGDPDAEAIFAELGWHREPHPQGLQLTTISFDPEVDASAVARRLYLTLGDSDLV